MVSGIQKCLALPHQQSASQVQRFVRYRTPTLRTRLNLRIGLAAHNADSTSIYFQLCTEPNRCTGYDAVTSGGDLRQSAKIPSRHDNLKPLKETPMTNEMKDAAPGTAKCRPAGRMLLRMRAGAMALGVAGAMALASGVAGAAEVTFAGYTDGCFGTGICAPPTTPTTPTQVLTFGGLTFSNSTFLVTTSLGFAAIGDQPGTPNFNNLGSFSLTTAPFTYDGEHFNMAVTFTLPSSVSPNPTIFNDVILGTVSSTNSGGVFINFDNTPQHRIFGSGATAGSFDFSINDVSVTPGLQAGVTGTITAISAVPEPENYAMMLTGLGLMGFVGRRRKQHTA
jgi:hypothetical protein